MVLLFPFRIKTIAQANVSQYNEVWNTPSNNFLNLCKLLGCESYLSGNVGSGTVQELADWVQYTNAYDVCPMSELRKQNGQNDACEVRFWGIGNEAWGCGGNMTPEHYADLFRQYTTFMSNPTKTPLFKIASGANNSDYNWTEVLMKKIPTKMTSGLALHHYSITNCNKKGYDTNFTEAQYFATMKSAWQMDELI